MKPRWTIHISGKDYSVRTIKIHPIFLLVFFFIVLSLTAFSGYSGYTLYRHHSCTQLIYLEEDLTVGQKSEINDIAHKVAMLDKEMDVLRSYNRRLIESSRIDLDIPAEFRGMGGSGADSPISSKTTGILAGKGLKYKLRTYIQEIANNLASEQDLSKNLLSEIERQQMILSRTPSLWPARGWMTSRFGWRESPFTSEMEYHTGIDIASRQATPIYAPADGTVTSYYSSESYGNVMLINHGNGMITKYGHLHKPAVEVGMQVKKGDRIAFLGNTGHTTGSHLHYEILINGVNVNPQRYMLK